MDFNTLKKNYSKIDRICEIVAEYEVSLLENKKALKIRIFKINNNNYTWETNLSVKGAGTVSPYNSSVRYKDSVDSALDGALGEFFAFYSEDAQIIENKNW